MNDLSGWLKKRVNLEPQWTRRRFECTSNIYDYRDAEAGSLVVDFANKHVGACPSLTKRGLGKGWKTRYNSQRERVNCVCVGVCVWDCMCVCGGDTGGGCFGSGFVQEEQMVAQSVDLAARLKESREVLGSNSAYTYEGVHMDTWWTRKSAAQKG